MNAGKTLHNFDAFRFLYTFSNKMATSQWSVLFNIQ